MKPMLPTYIQISEMLIRDIAAGRYLDGARLPPERQMAADLGISVGTLRKALADIKAKGLLEKRQGSGNYVKVGAAPNSVYSFFRVELIDGGGLPTAHVLSVDLLPKPATFPAFGPAAKAYRIRRLLSLNAQPAVLEEIWLDGDQAAQISRSELSHSIYLYYRNVLKLWIAEAEDQLGLEPVPQWAPDAFEPTSGTPCLFAARLSRSQTGETVEYSKNWIDTNVASYVARIK